MPVLYSRDRAPDDPTADYVEVSYEWGPRPLRWLLERIAAPFIIRNVRRSIPGPWTRTTT
jgi:hypothetical protein